MQIHRQTYIDFTCGRIDSFYASAYASFLMYATNVLGSDYSFLAEDCVQDAIFEAYKHRADFKDEAKLKSFLYRCIHNKAISLLRKRHSFSNYLNHQEVFEDNVYINNSIIEQETMDILFNAIEHLPADLKIVFEMSFENSMKNQEIADALGITTHAVKKRKAKLISSLRNMLSKEELLVLMFFLNTDYVYNS